MSIVNKSGTGLWAAVTGASDGLGKEFARQLAAQGYNLLLVARRETLLNAVKTELESEFGVTVEVCVCDLARSEDVRRLEERLVQCESLEFMVNNAGFGRDGAFPDVDPDLEEEMIQVHVVALMRLSQAALVPMCKRKKGFLINLSSVAAFLQGANCAEYMATKAYVLSFSQCIQYDVERHGVRVQALCPGLTHTGFHGTETMKGFQKDKTPGIAWLSAEYVVRSSLRAVRKSHGIVCVPSFRYKLVLLLLCNPIGRMISKSIYARRAMAAVRGKRAGDEA